MCMAKPLEQGLSQDLETGCPKLEIVKFLGVLFTQITTTNMYLLNGKSIMSKSNAMGNMQR